MVQKKKKVEGKKTSKNSNVVEKTVEKILVSSLANAFLGLSFG